MYKVIKNGIEILSTFSYDYAIRCIEKVGAWATGPDEFRDNDGNRFEISY